jgi:hypothetical protein
LSESETTSPAVPYRSADDEFREGLNPSYGLPLQSGGREHPVAKLIKGENAMRAAWIVPLLILGFVLCALPAVAQHHAAKPKAQKPRTDAELIVSAMSAAPSAISADATIVAVGADGKLRTLRQGQGAFTCVPDDPATPGVDPMCLDRHGMEWFKALLAHEKPPEGQVWLAYMLKGGSDASNDDPFASEPPTGKKWVQTGPHVMIGGPAITKMLDSYPATADDTRKPYVMFGGTPYEHLMMPVR